LTDATGLGAAAGGPAAPVLPPPAGAAAPAPPAPAAPPASAWRVWHTVASIGILAAIIGIAIWAGTSKTLVTDLHGRLPVWTFLALFVLFALFAVLVGWGIAGEVGGVLIDPMKGRRMSLSRLQMLLWTFLVLAAYLDAFLVNISAGRPHPLDVSIPGELLLAMGISVTSLAGARIVLSVKQSNDSAAVYKGRLARWRDLFEGDTAQTAHALDLGKIQMFYITIALVLGYGIALATGFADVTGGIGSLPALDQAFVVLLAISHAGYLTTKAAS
jgi:hypothetical protein